MGRMKRGLCAAGPNHRPGPGNLANHFRQDAGQNFRGGLSQNHLLHRNAFALGSVDDHEFRDRHALFFREAIRGACRLARHIECNGLRRPDNFARDIFLFYSNISRDRYEPSRSAECLNRFFNCRLADERVRRKMHSKYCFKLARSFRNHARGNFFAADFEKKIAGCRRMRAAGLDDFASSRWISLWTSRDHSGGSLHRCPLIEPCARDLRCQFAHPPNHPRALCH